MKEGKGRAMMENRDFLIPGRNLTEEGEKNENGRKRGVGWAGLRRLHSNNTKRRRREEHHQTPPAGLPTRWLFFFSTSSSFLFYETHSTRELRFSPARSFLSCSPYHIKRCSSVWPPVS
jgi:hypothetical protein